MANNVVIILNSILDQRKKITEEDISDSDFFELFTFEQLLKDFDLSDDEIVEGKTGGGDDGGIDGFFILLNSDLLLEGVNPNEIKKNPIIDLFIIQSKGSTSFSEDVFEKLLMTTSDIFDLTKDIDKLKNFYNSSVTEKADLFRKTYVDLASKHSILKVHFYYATKGDTNKINKKIKNKANTLKEKSSIFLPSSSIDVNFFGARELLDLSRKEKSYTLTLNFIQNYLSKGANDYVVLSNLIDYYDFVTDESGNLRNYIFESNVRDYQGDIAVNKDIQNTLISEKDLDFCWLNNGITILASKVSVTSKQMVLDDVQIVNGLQTTRCIYDYFREKKGSDDSKRDNSILMKIIVTDLKNAVARDKIIKATNFQTRIPDASLRATDSIQRDIEDYFKRHEWYYDRRKNYYKNLGNPMARIISIPYLSQAIMAIISKKPHIARGRPSSLIKKDVDYAKVFDVNCNPHLYLLCAQIMKKIEGLLRKNLDTFKLPEKTNFRFHISMIIVMYLTINKDYTIDDLSNIKVDDITVDMVDRATTHVLELANEFIEGKGGTLDRAAKRKDFLDQIIEKLDI
ncbi:MAG: hypothetical protein EF812_07045 [Methanosarcinales archaeon]|nr:MAG: hypothetical protein EF812_07045 [Methanosarcinales archaeon]